MFAKIVVVQDNQTVFSTRARARLRLLLNFVACLPARLRCVSNLFWQYRPVVPDPGALQAFPFWANIDKGDKPVSIVQIALRLEALKTRQRHLWPCPPVISGDGKVVAFRDQQSLYIVNASEPWEATKADDGTAADTVGGCFLLDEGVFFCLSSFHSALSLLTIAHQ